MRAKLMRLYDDHSYMEENGTIYYDRYHSNAKQLENYFKGNLTIDEDIQEDIDDDKELFISKLSKKINKKKANAFITNANETDFLIAKKSTLAELGPRRNALNKHQVNNLQNDGNAIIDIFSEASCNSHPSSKSENSGIKMMRKGFATSDPFKKSFTVGLDSLKDENLKELRKVITPRFSIKEV
jgi:hypothetical protein